MENLDVNKGTARNHDMWRPNQAPTEARTGGPANRAEMAANVIAHLAANADADERLGSKDQIRERCAVSVGTFNEALKLAQMRGIVSLRRGPGGGIFAAKQTPLGRLGNKILKMEGSDNLVADIQRMRNALDPLIIEDALMYSSAADIADLRGNIENMRQSISDKNMPGFVRQNWAFQIRIANICPNTMLRSVSLSLLEILEQHAVNLPLPSDERGKEMLRRRFRHYEEMADALESRDREGALRVLHEHNSELQPTAAPSNRGASDN